MRRATTGAMAFSTLFLAGLASSQTDGREQRFNQRDANRDGYLTQSEYGGHPGNFRALDRDGDNQLSRDEFVRRGGGVGGGGGPVVALPDEFAYLDLNADSNLSRAEWYGRDVPFERADLNNDGRITRDEFRNPPTADNRQDRFYGLDADSDGVLSRREWRGETVVFGSADANGDGVVSLREYLGMPQVNDDRAVRFEELDRNQDGVLRSNEWRTAGVAFTVADRNDDGVVTLREYLDMPRPGDDRAVRFEDLDRDSDGYLQRNEWRGSRESFDLADRNRDGVVALREYRGVVVESDGRAVRFEDLDRDNDGSLERNEWRASRQSFDLADGNDDGRVTLREYLSTVSDSPTEEFRFMDRNRDGFLTRGEWSGSRDSFARWDRNRDGRVSRNEYAALPYISAR